MTATVAYVVHEDPFDALPHPSGSHHGPRREFSRLEDALAWQQESAPSWEITKIITRLVPASEAMA